MKKLIAVGILVVVVALGAWRFFLSGSKSEAAEWRPITRTTIVNAVYGIGTLTAQRSLQLKSGVTTSIQAFYVKEGDTVGKGQRLVRLEGVGDFIAPFSGVVTDLTLRPGETVFAQSALMTLTDFEDLYLSVAIEQEGALKIKSGLPVKVSFDGLRGQSFEGRVESVYSSGTDFRARISVLDLPRDILPGMSGDAAIILNEKPNALVLPLAVLNGNMARVRRNGKVMNVPIEIGLIDGASAEVVKGDIREGDEAALERKPL